MPTITVSTNANNGHLVFCLRGVQDNVIILTLKDTDNQNCSLVSGEQYRVEWYFWSDRAAQYTISASTNPQISPFPISHTFKYNGPHEDNNLPFTFTA